MSIVKIARYKFTFLTLILYLWCNLYCLLHYKYSVDFGNLQLLETKKCEYKTLHLYENVYTLEYQNLKECR